MEMLSHLFLLGKVLFVLMGYKQIGERSLRKCLYTMESYKTFGASYKDTLHVSSSALSHFPKSIPNLTSTP